MSDYRFSENELIIVILKSPRFERECKNLVNITEKAYKIKFPKLPVKSYKTVDKLKLTLFSIDQMQAYGVALNELLAKFKLDKDNSRHKTSVETALFYGLIPTSDYKPGPVVDYDPKEQHTRIFIEVFPWTSQDNLIEAFKPIRDAYKSGSIFVPELNRAIPIKMMGVPKERYKEKELLVELDMYFLFRQFEREFVIDPNNSDTKREQIWEDTEFIQKKKALEAHYNHTFRDLDTLIRLCNKLDAQLKTYNLI